MKTLLTAALLLVTGAGPVLAQAAPLRPEPVPVGIRYGKWATAALAAGLTALGISAHRGADADFRSLVDFCQSVGGCAIGDDGRYQNSEAESRYRAVASGDRAARAYLLGGQASLAAAVVLWVMELKRQRGPRNIPYSPFILQPGEFGPRVGLRLAW